jgi:hypothetical protein
MTIPELSLPFFLSLCGLSVVCVGSFVLLLYFVLRAVSGELFGNGKSGQERQAASAPTTASAQAEAAVGARPNLRARADRYRSDLGGAPAPQAASHPAPDPLAAPPPATFTGDARSRLRERAQEWNPNAPSEPFPRNIDDRYNPGSDSRIGGRDRRHSQLGEGRNSAGDSFSNDLDAPRTPNRGELSARRRDEMFGGLDDNGDGTPDV